MSYIIYRSRLLSRAWQGRKLLTIFAALVTLIVLCIISLASGQLKLSALEIIRVLTGSGAFDHTLVVMHFRMPRIIVGVLAGAALGVSGLVLQGTTRNPLASAEVLGITGGASVGAIGFFLLRSSYTHLSIRLVPVAAIIGALTAYLILWLLVLRTGSSPIRLVLTGVGMASIAQALTTLGVVLSPIFVASQAYVWLTGSVYAATWSHVQILLPWTIGGLSIVMVSLRALDLQELGDEVGAALGSNVKLRRQLLVLTSVVLTGSAVAVVGPIGFIGLLVPHLGRRLVGAGHGSLAPLTALVGAIVLVAADLVGRTMFLPLDLPAGIFTAAAGAPYFISLLITKRPGR